MLNKIFLAFPGHGVTVEKISCLKGVKIFNLDNIDCHDFIKLINKEVKPFNKNIVRNNEKYFCSANFAQSYKHSNWGILLPLYNDGYLMGEYIARYLMKLFSGVPLQTMFSISSMGVDVKKTSVSVMTRACFHEEDKKFLNSKFLKFYKIMFPVMTKAQWYAPNVSKWGYEDWRLYISHILFDNIEKYYRQKTVMTWQSECADIVTLYETLLSRRKNDGGLYKISQRVNVLLGETFNDIEKKEFSYLYNYRNEFVHGSFFERLKKTTKTYSDDKNMAQLPRFDYSFLTKQSDQLRKVFIIYLYLIKQLSDKNIVGTSVAAVINDGVFDIKLRKELQKHTKDICNLL